MLRKAAIVLLLAASFLGAQAMDFPKPARELTSKNKTKATKASKGAGSKAKTVELCLEATGVGQKRFDGPSPNSPFFLALIGASVYDCDDVDGATGVPAMNADPIGVAGVTCTGFLTTTSLALCQTEMSLDTEWHKTVSSSSLVGTFWADVEPLARDVLTMINPVVTGATGAWGKVANIKDISLAPIGTTGLYYTLTINYKGRGWNPAA